MRTHPHTSPLLTHHTPFSPDASDDSLRDIPAAPGVFALFSDDPAAEPYLSRAADIRRRLRRLLAPPEISAATGQPVLSRRLNLRNRVRRIEWSPTGSEFESILLLYRASITAFGPEATRKRLRLHTPFFVRLTLSNPLPRLYVTNRLSKRALHEYFGPFPSRAAAERYTEAVLDLFQLRRCHEDLTSAPDHPGCVYGEIGRCMRPCQFGNPTACTPAQYAQESMQVHAFLRTHGESLLTEIAARRNAASEALDFETAAALHKQHERVKATAALADPLVREPSEVRCLIVQPGATQPALSSSKGLRTMEMWGDSVPSAAVFLFERGHIAGPQPLSTLGVRAVREQTEVGSSLFAQPLMLAPVPLDEPASGDSTLTPEDRARAVLETLTADTASPADPDTLCDHLSLLRRWYYRPEKQRPGEALLPNPDGIWPLRRLLNAAARVALGPPTKVSPVDRDAAKKMQNSKSA